VGGGEGKGEVRKCDKLYRVWSSETVVGRRALSLAKRSESGEEPEEGSGGSSAICSAGFRLLLVYSVYTVYALRRGETPYTTHFEKAGGLVSM
jgi:hypothetical protein